VGDTCRIAGQLGEVEDVTLWATRLRTNDRTVVSIPNGVVMEAQIENLSRRDKFWFHPIVGLVYDTTAGQLRRVLDGLRQMLATDPRVETEGARVRFLRLAESSLDLEVFAYVRAATWPEFLEVQEELLLRLLEIVTEAGTSVAFPSRTLYLAGQGAAGPA
jgi:MscS family membrane protein